MTGKQLTCVECRTSGGGLTRGWIAIRCEDPELDEAPELAVYCPGCAWAEFGVERRRQHSD